MEYTYNTYSFRNVYHNLDPATRQEIIDLWTGEGVVSAEAARKRVDEVVFTIRNPAGQLAGVTTVYVDNFVTRDNPYYFMRAFIRSRDRVRWGLLQFVSGKAIEFLKHHGDAALRPKGMIALVENRKGWRVGARRYLERNGWSYLGIGPRGNHVWYINFDGSPMPQEIQQRFGG